MGGALVQRWGEASAVKSDASQQPPHQPPQHSLDCRFSVLDRSPNAKAGEAPLISPRFGFYESLQSFQQSADTLPPVDALLLAVRPGQILSALASCLPLLSPRATVMSLAAGLPLARMRATLPRLHGLFRVMPSIPVAIGEGILLISGEQPSDERASDAVQALFAPMGSSVVCSEELLEKGTGLWGSAPGYIFHMLEAFEEAACALGYDRAQARILSFQTFKGVGLFGEQERKEQNATPRALTQSIALKGGTTEAGLTVLADQEKGLVALMKQASLRAYQRSLKMAQETDKP